MAFELQSTSPDGSMRVEVVDNDRVVYAYLFYDDIIVADVWLYNRISAPLVPEWTLADARKRLPFLNAADYVFNPLAREEPCAAFEVVWRQSGVGIYLHGRLIAILRRGEKPGRCVNAMVDNEIAHRLEFQT